MIDGSARSASVTALRESKVSFVSRAAFEAFGRQHPEMYQHLMVLLARRLRDTNSALAATSFLSVKGRVARSLLSLAEAFGHDVGDPVRPISRDVTDLSAPARPGGLQRVEERTHGGPVPARRRPYHPPGVVIDDHRQVLVVALV